MIIYKCDNCKQISDFLVEQKESLKELGLDNKNNKKSAFCFRCDEKYTIAKRKAFKEMRKNMKQELQNEH